MKSILFFLFNPFLALVNAIRKNNATQLQTGLFVFTIFIGATMLVQDGTDIDAYVTNLEYFYELHSRVDFITVFDKYIQSVQDSSELLLPTLIFSISFITKDPNVLTFILSILLSIIQYFLFSEVTRNWLNLEIRRQRIFYVCFLFILGPCWSINGRFWLGFWYILLKLLRYFSLPEMKNILKLIPVVFIHNGLLIFVLITLFFHLTYRNKFAKQFYFTIFILAFIFSEFASEYIVEYSKILGGGYESKSKTYADVLINIKSPRILAGSIWFVEFKMLMWRYIIPLLFFLQFYPKVKFNINSKKSIASLFLMAFYAIYTFFKDIPSLGGRYLEIWVLIYFFLQLDLMSKFRLKWNSKQSIFLPFVLVIFSFSLFVGIRLEIVQASFFLVIGNILVLPFIYLNNFSIRDLVFYFLN